LRDERQPKSHEDDDIQIKQYRLKASGRLADHPLSKEGTQPGAENSQCQAADYLVASEGYSQESMDTTHHTTGDASGCETENRAACVMRCRKTRQRSHQHQAFQPQVDDAAFLCYYLPQGGEQQGCAGCHSRDNGH